MVARQRVCVCDTSQNALVLVHVSMLGYFSVPPYGDRSCFIEDMFVGFSRMFDVGSFSVVVPTFKYVPVRRAS